MKVISSHRSDVGSEDETKARSHTRHRHSLYQYMTDLTTTQQRRKHSFLDLAKNFVRVSDFKYRVAVIAVSLKTGSILFEGLSVGMILPLMQYINAGSDVAALQAESEAWRKLVWVFDQMGLPTSLGTFLVVIFLSVLLRQFFQYFTLKYMNQQTLWLVRDVRTKVFRRVIAARMSFLESMGSGQYVNTIVTEVERSVGSLFPILNAANSFLLLAFYVGFLITLSVWMTVFLVVVSCIQVFFLRGLMSHSRIAGADIAEGNRKLSGFLIERLNALRLIHLSGTEERESACMAATVYTLHEKKIWAAILGVRIPLIYEPMAVFAMCAFVYLGIEELGLGIEVMLLYAGITIRSLPVIQGLLKAYQTALSNMASLKAVMTAMDDLEREQEPSGGEEIFPSTFGAIRFDNVSFHYDNKKIAALSEVTVEFNAGTFIALVGPNGAGKSTLVDLLPRLRDPTRGRIEVDGTPLTNFTLNSLRQNTAFVSQEPQLFDVTIQEHIRYSCAGANDKEVREAARLASAVGFIEALPEGYDTQLGERGVRLSGGQRQRIDLARALLCRAPVLIMDEPASGLDARAAGQFREIMMQIRQQAGTTIILIAHGFSTVMDADQIVVLEAGRITDTGTHEELLSRDGWYAKAFAEQTSSGASSRAARGAG